MWEHLTRVMYIDLDLGESFAKLDDYINLWGQKGWEPYSTQMQHNSAAGRYGYTVFFKRWVIQGGNNE